MRLSIESLLKKNVTLYSGYKLEPVAKYNVSADVLKATYKSSSSPGSKSRLILYVKVDPPLQPEIGAIDAQYLPSLSDVYES
jgi:hypothetical protein